MKKKISLLLATLLTGTATAGIMALGDNLKQTSNKEDNNPQELSKLDKETSMSSINNILDYLGIGTSKNESMTEEGLVDGDSTANVEIPAEEKADCLTITGDTNTKKDIMHVGQISINNSDFQLSEDINNRLLKAIEEIEGKGLKVGFYLTDVETNMTISYNATEDFQPASSVKAGFALYAVKEIDSGKYSLNDKMKYEEKHQCGGSGSIKNSPFGTEFTLREIIHRTINESDNVGYYMLLDKFGYEGYNKMISDLGCKTWLSDYSKWGFMTPQELNLIWQEIYAYAQNSFWGGWLFEEFTNAQFNFVKQCLPEYKSAHKSGFNQQGFHDSAVVFGDRTYIMTIMTTQNWWTIENMDKIAEVLDDAVKEYNNHLIAVNSNYWFDDFMTGLIPE